MHLLLVDDDSSTRLIVKRALARLGLALHVHEARDADEAISVLGRQQVDVVLTDFKMPGPSGVDLLCATLERQPHATRVLMSGTLDVAMLRVEASRECVHFAFEKPMGLDGWEPYLRAAVARALGGPA